MSGKVPPLLVRNPNPVIEGVKLPHALESFNKVSEYFMEECGGFHDVCPECKTTKFYCGGCGVEFINSVAPPYAILTEEAWKIQWYYGSLPPMHLQCLEYYIQFRPEVFFIHTRKKTPSRFLQIRVDKWQLMRRLMVSKEKVYVYQYWPNKETPPKLIHYPEGYDW